MIKRYIQYTKEHKERIKKAYKDFLVPQYLGDEGGLIAVRAKDEKQALDKMIKMEMEFAEKTREETEEEMKLEDIFNGWLHLVDEGNEDHKEMVAEGCDVFVGWEQSDYPVFCYQI